MKADNIQSGLLYLNFNQTPNHCTLHQAIQWTWGQPKTEYSWWDSLEQTGKWVCFLYSCTSLQWPPWEQKTEVAIVKRLKQVRVNVCTVHPKEWLLLRGCCRGEVAVCEGLTLFIYVKNVLCFIYHRQLPSLTQLHTLHLRNTQVKTLWYILILNNIFSSVFVQWNLNYTGFGDLKNFFFCPFQRTVTNMPGKLESLVNLTGN